MLKNYLVSALRHLSRNRVYTILNVTGLSVGLACFTLIGLWVNYQLSYDKFHTKADRIYRIGGTFTDQSGSFDQAVTPIPLGPALENDMPEVEAAARIDVNDAIVRRGDKQFKEQEILLTDPSFFKLFDFHLLSGNPATALTQPYSIVLSKSIAQKYFGDDDPVGQSLRIYQYDPDGNGAEYKVTGVIEDCPKNSQFHYNMLGSFETIRSVDPDEFENWFDNSYYTYFLVRKGSDPKALQAKLPALVDKYMGENMRKYHVGFSYFMQPLTSIHLHSHLRYEIAETSSMSYVVIFATIGLIVLLLACINYVNLSTAYATARFREVGMRKVMGAFKRQLVGQYLLESWVLAMGALALSFLWIELSRSLFESLTGNPIVGLFAPFAFAVILLTASIVGLLAGLYPSVVLSSFKPARILRGQLNSGPSGVWLRKGLVIVQYTITIILVIGIFIVRMQMNYVQDKDLGFDKSNLLILGVNGNADVRQGYNGFMNDLLSHPAVTGIARSSTTLGDGLGNSVAEVQDADGKRLNATLYRFWVDYDFLDTYKMKLLAGRFFDKNNASDSTKAYVVNDATIRQLGFQDPADAIGTYFSMGGDPGTIIGVVQDYNYSSLQNIIAPTCMHLLRGGFSRISVRLDGNLSDGLALVTAAWKKHFPDALPDFRFEEDALNGQYLSEQRFSKIFMVFSILSLAIACLGLFALVAYSVESRTKEIGIRKVLGATIAGIIGMLSREFLTLIVVSAVVAIPAGYFFMQQWLDGFAYRIQPRPYTFIIAGGLVLGIAWLTISVRSLLAAQANPVDSLRNE